MTEYKPHITKEKKREVEEVKRLFNEYPVAGIVNLENLPTLQLQRMKKKLQEKIVLKHTKKRLIEIAIDQLKDKPRIQELKDKLKGVPALIFTREDPFSLFKLLKQNQSTAAAKPGQEAPEDLIFPAGPTSFVPGPMIGELGQLGLKTEIAGGKISVKEDKVLVKEGETISAKVAELLAKIGIEPMKIGLNLTFTYEKGEILGKEVLGVDEEEYIENIKLAHAEAFNLAVFAGYATPGTIKFLVGKAFREAEALAKAGNIQTSETVKLQLAEAEAAAKAVKAQMPEQPAEEKKEEPKEAAKQEGSEKLEKKVEAAVEEENPKEQEESQEREQKPVLSQEEPAPAQPKELKQGEEPVVTNAPEQKLEETVKEEVEKPEAAVATRQKTDEEVAQEVLRELTEGKIKKQEGSTGKAPSSAQADRQEQDMDKLINDLKDKKSKGEIQ